MMSHRWWVELEIMLEICFESLWISFYWLQYCQNVVVIYSAHLFYWFSRNKSQFIHLYSYQHLPKGANWILRERCLFMHLLSPIFSPWKIHLPHHILQVCPPVFSNDSLGLVIPPVIFVTAKHGLLFCEEGTHLRRLFEALLVLPRGPRRSL